MSSDDDHIRPARNFEAQSAFASTLVNDVEKAGPSKISEAPEKQHKSLFGVEIETPKVHPGSDAVFAAKAQLLNQALLDMGMGIYQWMLFLMTGVGWFLDSFWIMSFIVIAPSSGNEAQFFFPGDNTDYLFISLFVGLTVGGTAWPMMSDTLGRKWMFTSTIVLMGMGGLVGAGLPSFTGLCVVGCVVGFAVAGNQAVDAMILLESLPASHQYLVALQGVFWGLGQLVAAAVGWAFIALYTCGTGPDEVSTSQSMAHKRALGHSSSASSSSDSSSSCHYVSNKGWRYVWWTFGCMTLFLYLCRFALNLHETPKFLLSRRRDAETTQLVKDIALHNKRQTWLTEASFARIDSTVDGTEAELRTKSRPQGLVSSLNIHGTVSLVLLWSVMGLTFVLHQTYISNYLAARGVAQVNATTASRSYLYSRYIYVALCGIPGPLVAAILVEVKGLGRKRTGAGIAILTGLFMLLATLAKSRSATLAFECIISFLRFAGIATLTLYTVEVVPTTVRGYSLGVMGFFWGVFGLIAHIITTFDNTAVSGGGPVWFCGAVWILMAGAWLALPIETQARAAA
ncbi:hypothetical protein N7517_003750 [Penicillium concentricum]|uniref:Major facilitator superfamily (MFS) profile domain-containing protein n=1 Tax=Penicillium concentricum TaxID=293559 RepID=A0A9W9S6A8_9EURO|nr:uncharacterized protein N7517_003750 [Penicillium concentricum]KAJ5371744.1 hypothetical protein N7517_003750 [Penicillium concentricum]